MNTPTTQPLGLAAAVRDAARLRPDATAMTFLDYATDRSGTAVDVTYRQLHTKAAAVASALSRTSSPGDRVAILCPHTADYVAAFLGCLYTGVLAVPLYAPDASRSDERLLLAMADCAPSAVLTTTPHEQQVRHLLGGASTAVVAVDTADPAQARGVLLPVAERPDDIAYLQYTSGSTRNPAGVEVTHLNLAVGAEQLRAGLGIGEDARIAGWLPFFHDMGLLLMIAVPLITGTPAVLMAPFAFIQQPVRWLRAISDHRATHTVSPNFGLDLCVDRISGQAREGLDLSSLRALVNGSEPVRATTLDRFTARFGPYGFQDTAHCPSYGLAEATLAVTLGGPEAPRTLRLSRAELARDRVRVLPDGDTDGYRVVACGTPADQEVRIVDPATGEPLPPDAARTGEVWVRGTNVCAGYWRQPERTAEVFGAALSGAAGPESGADGGGSWLRTGDLGFVHDGELYLTGRLKDLIVVDGRNHHSADVELTVQGADSAIRPGHVAAFPAGLLGEDGERAVVVAELDRGRASADLAEVRSTIRRSVLSRHSLDVAEVVLIRRGTLPKTTSGKIRRAACRDLYLAGALTAATTAGEGSR
ncbi:fatty acyl-AMP ligase [Streptomyces sp. BRA346]|uniref:fatty acyl-AMP ligase n=1 Tax=Streptomyces sp. BRA346 TaxID=2878199 RepID=UPI004064497D